MTPSPRRLKEQVKETVSELPIHAARLAVMGVGRALMLTDRVRKDYRDVRQTGLGPVLGRLRDDAESLTGAVVGKVAGRQESNGQVDDRPRPTDESEISVGKPTEPARPPKPAATTRPASPPPAPKSAAKPEAAKPKPATPKAASDLPVSDYDDASIASVRARLRGLDARQVAELRDYERANAARADFLRMYENRIAKLKAGG